MYVLIWSELHLMHTQVKLFIVPLKMQIINMMGWYLIWSHTRFMFLLILLNIH